jgi:hypothetical protein
VSARARGPHIGALDLRLLEMRSGLSARMGEVAPGGVTGSPGCEVALLHSNVRDGIAQRSVGDLQQARERTVEFQDQEDRP